MMIFVSDMSRVGQCLGCRVFEGAEQCRVLLVLVHKIMSICALGVRVYTCMS